MVRPGVGARRTGEEGQRESYDRLIVVGGRYEVVRPLARGGMALVYEVIDHSSDQRIALKRLILHTDDKKRMRTAELFEREYHTLCQLKHPRIVTVYDYALDEGVPYYTMELLDGGDLQDIAPTSWQRACAIARDLCSALSLLHSRRLVHRDLTLRNVRCTSDGLAKLIDFGAMAAVGPSKFVVGTPTYCAPEIAYMQAMDGRTDLYALGATLYFTLTGRHAYPSPDFASLPARWQMPLSRPSDVVAGIPEALDRLVLELLALDPAARPSSAAEVSERLSAIVGGAHDEQLVVAQAYLTTPNLVGRDAQLGRARRKLQRAARGGGSALLIDGASGVGRTRMLDACVLEAKLLGATVLRADADDAREGDYGVVRALCRQLLAAAHEAALNAAVPKLPVLGHALPELLARVPKASLQPFDDPLRLRPELQAALREWLLAIGRDRPLLLAVDDVQRADEPSAALIAVLAHDLRRTSLAIVATRDPHVAPLAPAPLALLEDASGRVQLTNLDATHTEQLLRSLFGDVPHLSLVAHRLHELSSGNPRDLLRLAQHLVDRGLASYRAGAWSLPGTIDASDLPSSMAQALALQLARLSPAARELGALFALAPEQSVSFEECLALSGSGQAVALLPALDELLHADVLRMVGEGYVLSRQGWVPLLRAGLDDDRERELSLRLAQLYERRPDESFRTAQYLLRGGESERAIDVLLAHVQATTEQTEQRPAAFSELVRALPHDWRQTFEQVLRLCGERRRKQSDVYTLLARYAGLCSVMATHDPVFLPELLRKLERDCGLDLWDSLDPTLEGLPRVAKALELAKLRNDQLPEQERGLGPVEALRLLGRVLIQAGGAISTTYDVPLLETLPSLEPFVALSPALGVTHTLINAIRTRLTARIERSQQLYAQVIERTSQPDRGGIGASHFTYMRLGTMYALGMLEAAHGLRSSLEWADRIEADPLHKVNAFYLRMIHQLSQGDVRGAERSLREVELLRIQSSARQYFEGTYLVWRSIAFAALDDLTRIKQTCEQLAPLAQQHPGWVPVHQLALGEYQRIRGDLHQALASYSAAMRAMAPAGHQVWPYVAGAELRALHGLGRLDEGLQRGLEHLATAEQRQIGLCASYVLMPLALIEARLGKREPAIEHSERAIAAFEAHGVTGVNLVLAYETRARVAIVLRDQLGYDRMAARCAEVVRAATSSALVAKYERLRQDARHAEVEVNGEEPLPLGESHARITTTRITSMIHSCVDADARAQCALSLLTAASGADAGFLFLLSPTGPVEVARLGDRALSAGIGQMVHELIREAREAESLATSIAPQTAPSSGEWTGKQGEHFRPVLLSHDLANGFAITGVALLGVAPGMPFLYPASIATELSRMMLAVGDVDAPTIGSARRTGVED